MVLNTPLGVVKTPDVAVSITESSELEDFLIKV